MESNADVVGMLTMDEVARLLSLHRDTVKKLALQGELGAVRIGRQYRFPRRRIQEFIDANRIGVKAAS